MLILRPFVYILAILGYLLGGIGVYLAYNPIKYPTQSELNLEDIFNCNVGQQVFNPSTISEEELSKTKELLGSNAPVEMIKELSVNLDSVANRINSSTLLTIQDCNINTIDFEKPIEHINSYLSNKSKYFEYGSIDSFVANFNEIPFVRLNNIKFEVESIYAKSSFCNRSINNSNLYLFTLVDTNLADKKKIILFNMSFKPTNSTQDIDKAMTNIIFSGHYLKAQANCNG